jgi:hypothetical protein
MWHAAAMTKPQNTDGSERQDRPGKTRIWWHPLLARLLDYELATGYAVRDEVLVGKLPLRVATKTNSMASGPAGRRSRILHSLENRVC